MNTYRERYHQALEELERASRTAARLWSRVRELEAQLAEDRSDPHLEQVLCRIADSLGMRWNAEVSAHDAGDAMRSEILRLKRCAEVDGLGRREGER